LTFGVNFSFKISSCGWPRVVEVVRLPSGMGGGLSVCDCSSDRHNVEEIRRGPQNWPQTPARRESAPLAFGAGRPGPAPNTRDVLDTPQVAHASSLPGEECHDSSQPVSDPGACFSQFVRLRFVCRRLASGGLFLAGEGGTASSDSSRLILRLACVWAMLAQIDMGRVVMTPLVLQPRPASRSDI